MPQYLAEIKENKFVLDAQEARHLKVARVRAGETINLFNGTGKKYLGMLEKADGKEACGKILEELPCALPAKKITLCFCAISRPATEELLDMCAQAGVFALRPVISKRSEPELLKKWESKKERWRQILTAAAKQCMTPIIPQIYPPANLEQALKEHQPSIFCYEREDKLQIMQALKDFKDIKEFAVFIGPEGGFTEEEIALALKYKAVCAGLGVNILRAQTAALAAVWAGLNVK